MTTLRWRALSSSDRTRGATQRWRFDLAYDGRGLHGFAEQPGHPTVVGLLRSTLTAMFDLDPTTEIVGAGRTDAGVHAFAQVIHVDLPTPLFRLDKGPEAERLIRSVNAQLKGHVRLLRVQPVDSSFHARFSAIWRAYRYLVVPVAPPALGITDALAWSVEGPLDVLAMNEAADAVVGVHDFRSFCRKKPGATSDEPLTREVTSARWTVVPDDLGVTPEGSPLFRLDIRASSFCHQMVRSLTAAFVAVGQGAKPPTFLADRLLVASRDGMPSPAPAQGLSLIGVGYPQFAGGPFGLVT